MTEALIRDTLRREKAGIKDAKQEVRRQRAVEREAQTLAKQQKEARRKRTPKA